VRDAAPERAVLAGALIVFEALETHVQITLRVELPVAVAVIVVRAPNTQTELGAAELVLTIGSTGVFAGAAGLVATPSLGVATLARTALKVISALDTALEIRITSLCVQEHAVGLIVASVAERRFVHAR
jgi:hypothetical protein